jgi:hypothetical protein
MIFFGRRQISEDGGKEPLWSKDGLNIYYRSGDEIMSVDVETSHVFKLGKRVALFQDIFVQSMYSQNYDIHPADEQFLMLKNLRPSSITVILNWIEELKHLVPTGK